MFCVFNKSSTVKSIFESVTSNLYRCQVINLYDFSLKFENIKAVYICSNGDDATNDSISRSDSIGWELLTTAIWLVAKTCLIAAHRLTKIKANFWWN